MRQLRGITWNHSRGFVPVIAAAQRFCELHKDVEITWEKRSLKEFGDAPVEALAQRYDLLVMDHPWAGFAARNNVVLPLNKYLPEAYLKDQRENSVGRSYESYSFEGFQSALPIDAAAPVAASRENWFGQQDIRVPKTWAEVLSLARKGRVAYAGDPTNVLMQFYMFGNTLTDSLFAEGQEEVIRGQDGRKVLEIMREFSQLCSGDMFSLDPIGVYELLAGSSPYVYTPFEFGYSNYSRRGYGLNRVIATDVVSAEGKPLKTVLGGTGLAISRCTKEAEIALEFVMYTASSEIQSTLYFENGGQPAHRTAWLDREVNRQSRQFFWGTLETLDRAYLRPRYDGYLYFQDRAGVVLRNYLRDGGSAEYVLEQLNRLYRESKGK